MTAALDAARAEGVPAAFCLALSNFSQRICTSLGFQLQKTLQYSQYTQDGSGVFDPALMGEHSTGTLYTKSLQ